MPSNLWMSGALASRLVFLIPLWLSTCCPQVCNWAALSLLWLWLSYFSPKDLGELRSACDRKGAPSRSCCQSLGKQKSHRFYCPCSTPLHPYTKGAWPLVTDPCLVPFSLYPLSLHMCDCAEWPHVLNLIVQHCLAQTMQKLTGSVQNWCYGKRGLLYRWSAHRHSFWQMLLCSFLATESLKQKCRMQGRRHKIGSVSVCVYLSTYLSSDTICHCICFSPLRYKIYATFVSVLFDMGSILLCSASCVQDSNISRSSWDVSCIGNRELIMKRKRCV